MSLYATHPGRWFQTDLIDQHVQSNIEENIQFEIEVGKRGISVNTCVNDDDLAHLALIHCKWHKCNQRVEKISLLNMMIH